jgi:hypothetical protein
MSEFDLFGEAKPKFVKPPPIDLQAELEKATETLAYWDTEVRMLADELLQPNAEYWSLLNEVRRTHPQRRGRLPVPSKARPDATIVAEGVHTADLSTSAVKRRKPLWVLLDENSFQYGKTREALRDAKQASKRAERHVKTIQTQLKRKGRKTDGES